MHTIPEKIIDFHTHILPCFDDGPSSCAESAQMLVKLREQGVTHAVSTSHFYRYDETVSDFLKRREEAYLKLQSFLSENGISDIPEIILGAEVYFSTALADDPLLEKLCIENTDHILIELPYSKLTANIIDSYRNLACCGRVRPVLAHIERYAAFAGEDVIFELTELSPAQINCESVMSTAGARLVSKLIRRGAVCAFGSDAHNMGVRAPRYSDGMKKLSRRLGANVFTEIMESSAAILDNSDI